jgi:hypothetical protein
MKNQDIDKLLRDHFNKLDIQPSTDIWKKIEAELDEQKVISISKKTTRLKVIGTAAAILVGLGIVSLVLQRQSANRPDHIKYADRKMDREMNTPPKAASKVEPLPIERQVQLSVRPVNKGNQRENSSANAIETDMKVVAIQTSQAFERLKMGKQQPLMVVVDTQTQVAHVLEYIPIKPLIENPDEENSMMASTGTNSQTVVTKVLNVLSKTINQGNSAEVQFSNDDEGSLQIDILNSLVKNKKRKK